VKRVEKVQLHDVALKILTDFCDISPTSSNGYELALRLSGIIKRGTGCPLNKLEEAAVGAVGCNPEDKVCIFPSSQDGVDELNKLDDAVSEKLFTSTYSKYVADVLQVKFGKGGIEGVHSHTGRSTPGISRHFKRRKLVKPTC